MQQTATILQTTGMSTISCVKVIQGLTSDLCLEVNDDEVPDLLAGSPVTDWPSMDSEIDQMWTHSIQKECAESKLPQSELVKPSGTLPGVAHYMLALSAPQGYCI